MQNLKIEENQQLTRPNSGRKFSFLRQLYMEDNSGGISVHNSGCKVGERKE